MYNCKFVPYHPQGFVPPHPIPQENGQNLSTENIKRDSPDLNTNQNAKNIIAVHIIDDLNTHDFSKSHIERKDIETLLNFKVKNISYYQRALVHKSILKAVKNYQGTIPSYLQEHNERMEFLGDSVLGLVVANYLYIKYPDNDEGFLTKMRTKIVNGITLAKIAKMINLGKYILMSNHVENIGGRDSNKILEDALEALIGAIFQDLGLESAEHFVLGLVARLDFTELHQENNFKDVLLRYCHNMSYPHPEYECVATEGPAHNRQFELIVKIGDKKYATGKAKNKKKAEQLAAQKTAEILKIKI